MTTIGEAFEELEQELLEVQADRQAMQEQLDKIKEEKQVSQTIVNAMEEEKAREMLQLQEEVHAHLENEQKLQECIIGLHLKICTDLIKEAGDCKGDNQEKSDTDQAQQAMKNEALAIELFEERAESQRKYQVEIGPLTRDTDNDFSHVVNNNATAASSAAERKGRISALEKKMAAVVAHNSGGSQLLAKQAAVITMVAELQSNMHSASEESRQNVQSLQVQNDVLREQATVMQQEVDVLVNTQCEELTGLLREKEADKSKLQDLLASLNEMKQQLKQNEDSAEEQKRLQGEELTGLLREKEENKSKLQDLLEALNEMKQELEQKEEQKRQETILTDVSLDELDAKLRERDELEQKVQNELKLLNEQFFTLHDSVVGVGVAHGELDEELEKKLQEKVHVEQELQRELAQLKALSQSLAANLVTSVESKNSKHDDIAIHELQAIREGVVELEKNYQQRFQTVTKSLNDEVTANKVKVDKLEHVISSYVKNAEKEGKEKSGGSISNEENAEKTLL